MRAPMTDDHPEPAADEGTAQREPAARSERTTLSTTRKIIVTAACCAGVIFVFFVLAKLLGSVADNLPIVWTLLATAAFVVCFVALGPGKTRRAVPGSIAVITLVAAIFALFGPFNQSQPAPAAIPRGEKLVEAWAKCPRGDQPMAAHPTRQIEKHPADPPRWYGKAHIDSVIAPDGGTNVGDQALVCITTFTAPGPNRTLWLILRLPATVGDGGHKLFFPVAPISNPQPGRYSFRLINNGCSSPVPGDYHTLMIVSANIAQSRELWKISNDESPTSCQKGYNTDYIRRTLIGTVISDQVNVIYEERRADQAKG